jgi:hypothetical protein
MSTVKTGIKAHDDTCSAAEGVRQTAVAAAGGNQATVRQVEITFYRTCLTSAIANNCGVITFMGALRSLGVTGQ